MKRVVTLSSMFAFVMTAMAFSAWTEMATAAGASADRIVVMYFHRTQRCPTCLKMGSYSEEAVKTGFAQQIKDGEVAFYYIDFQNPKNATFTKRYRVGGPALIVAKIVANKVAEFKDLKDIWLNVRDKPAFIKYVRANVTAYL